MSDLSEFKEYVAGIAERATNSATGIGLAPSKARRRTRLNARFVMAVFTYGGTKTSVTGLRTAISWSVTATIH
jgi:hypothetical protein